MWVLYGFQPEQANRKSAKVKIKKQNQFICLRFTTITYDSSLVCLLNTLILMLIIIK